VYKKRAVNISHVDGLTIEFDGYWFNVRPSNTENLLRLNIEARSKKILDREKRRLQREIKNS
jgi:phosphomannomutase